jgi:hypothetical protein
VGKKYDRESNNYFIHKIYWANSIFTGATLSFDIDIPYKRKELKKTELSFALRAKRSWPQYVDRFV